MKVSSSLHKKIEEDTTYRCNYGLKLSLKKLISKLKWCDNCHAITLETAEISWQQKPSNTSVL
jgi:hypothetical protein